MKKRHSLGYKSSNTARYLGIQLGTTLLATLVVCAHVSSEPPTKHLASWQTAVKTNRWQKNMDRNQTRTRSFTGRFPGYTPKAAGTSARYSLTYFGR